MNYKKFIFNKLFRTECEGEPSPENGILKAKYGYIVTDPKKAIAILDSTKPSDIEIIGYRDGGTLRHFHTPIYDIVFIGEKWGNEPECKPYALIRNHIEEERKFQLNKELKNNL